MPKSKPSQNAAAPADPIGAPPPRPPQSPTIGRVVHGAPPPRPPQSPTIGRVVHFTAKPGVIFAATVVSVNDADGTVGLCVLCTDTKMARFDFGDISQAPNDVPAGADEAVGMWSWPARV